MIPLYGGKKGGLKLLVRKEEGSKNSATRLKWKVKLEVRMKTGVK